MVYCGTSAKKTFVLTPFGSRWNSGTGRDRRRKRIEPNRFLPDFVDALCTVGFHNFNLRIFNLRVSNPNKLIVDVCLIRCRISMCQGLGPKKQDELLEIDRTYVNQTRSLGKGTVKSNVLFRSVCRSCIFICRIYIYIYIYIHTYVWYIYIYVIYDVCICMYIYIYILPGRGHGKICSAATWVASLYGRFSCILALVN